MNFTKKFTIIITPMESSVVGDLLILKFFWKFNMFVETSFPLKFWSRLITLSFY